MTDNTYAKRMYSKSKELKSRDSKFSIGIPLVCIDSLALFHLIFSSSVNSEYGLREISTDKSSKLFPHKQL